jgi:hypothetical protein
MKHLRFARRVRVERRIARQALLDAVLGEDWEPWSCASCSSATQDAPEAVHSEVFGEEAHNEDQTEEFLRSNIRKLSLTGKFQNSSLRNILTATATSPPPLPIAILRGAGSWRGAVAVSCAAAGSWRGAAGGSFLASLSEEQETEGLPDAQTSWGTLAQRIKRATSASPLPTSDDVARSPASTFCTATSAASRMSTFTSYPTVGNP